jgi:hypothetical protein
MIAHDASTDAIAAFLLVSAAFFSCYAWTVACRERSLVRRDTERLKLFAARDRLYRLLALGGVAAGGDEFKALREFICAAIRASDSTAALEMAAMLANEHEPSEGLERHIAHLSPAARLEYMAIIGDVAQATFDLIRLNSRLVRMSLRFRLAKPEHVAKAEEIEQLARKARKYTKLKEAQAA